MLMSEALKQSQPPLASHTHTDNSRLHLAPVHERLDAGPGHQDPDSHYCMGLGVKLWSSAAARTAIITLPS